VIEVEIPPPVYESWSDYMQRATKKELRERCSQIAVRANRRSGRGPRTARPPSVREEPVCPGARRGRTTGQPSL